MGLEWLLRQRNFNRPLPQHLVLVSCTRTRASRYLLQFLDSIKRIIQLYCSELCHVCRELGIWFRYLLLCRVVPNQVGEFEIEVGGSSQHPTLASHLLHPKNDRQCVEEIPKPQKVMTLGFEVPRVSDAPKLKGTCNRRGFSSNILWQGDGVVTLNLTLRSQIKGFQAPFVVIRTPWILSRSPQLKSVNLIGPISYFTLTFYCGVK